MTQPSNNPFATASAGEAGVVTDETPQKKRPGRKANPLTSLIREWDIAKSKADRARAAYDKVSTVAVRLEEAEARETEAYNALQEGLKRAGAVE